MSKITVFKTFYTIKELAERWKIPLDDVLHLGLTGQLKLYALVDIEYPEHFYLRNEPYIEYAQPLSLSTDGDLPRIIYEKKPFTVTFNKENTSNGLTWIVNYSPDLNRVITIRNILEEFEAKNQEVEQAEPDLKAESAMLIVRDENLKKSPQVGVYIEKQYIYGGEQQFADRIKNEEIQT